MHEILLELEQPDYEFLVGVIRSNFNLTDDAGLARALAALESSGSVEDRKLLVDKIVHEIRYLGSSELAYLVRYVAGAEPGVSSREILEDVRKTLGLPAADLSTNSELVEYIAREHATRQFASLSTDEQQRLLVDLGVEREKARAFLFRSAGVYSVPLMIEAFNAIVVEALIKKIIFGTIARIIGEQLSRKLFLLIAARFPWWLRWVGPAAWTLSIGWTAVDLQGPATMKTVPIVLYLGICSLRTSAGEEEPGNPAEASSTS
jgi:uncharacterized protein YaaW (UPF0174 family)